ncbi:Activator of 90 kDa heat shock ATPase [Gossypium australe]|uniref:Activator of 90 kDa heat shock ATPase n=1 Tax=Gossypium australe TaxID=47621 RepID=A0A5B6VRB7_9ROSI|nr:Activator of 90 kDa heat shock ATPase [Gossypium australe]
MAVQLSEEKDFVQQDKQQIIQDLKKSFLQPVREKLLQFEQELKDRRLDWELIGKSIRIELVTAQGGAPFLFDLKGSNMLMLIELHRALSKALDLQLTMVLVALS